MGCDDAKHDTKILPLGTLSATPQLNPPPQYIEDRLAMYNKLKAEHDTLLAERAEKDSKPIKITLPDGKVVDGETWKTTPYTVACGIRWGGGPFLQLICIHKKQVKNKVTFSPVLTQTQCCPEYWSELGI